MQPSVSVLALSLLAPIAVARAQDQMVILGARDSAAHVYRSDRSGYADATRLVIRDAEEWRRAWALLAAGRADTASPPRVDFRREIVILAAFGARPSAGHIVAIDTVRRAGVALEAVVRTVTPGDSCMNAFMLVQPVDVVRVPRSDRPVFFVERQSTVACK